LTNCQLFIAQKTSLW